MNSSARRATAVAGTFLAASSLVALAPAMAETMAPSHVTVHTTDTTPASGQTFRLSGAVFSEGHRVPAVVHVKTWRSGHWVPVTGAVMHTNRDNRYNLRIILQMKGERQLRVIGDPTDPGISTARHTIMVTVH